jgi:hypothetical protein
MPNDQEQARLVEAFARHGVEYMLIGQGAAILQDYWGTTQDIDVYPRKSQENCRRLINALRELGFSIDSQQEAEIMRGKDFIQLLEPFDLDIVFAPDGFESYEEALRHKTVAKGVPVMDVDGIIKSKESANRLKDKITLPGLYEFREYLRRRQRGDTEFPPGPLEERPKDLESRLDDFRRFRAAESRSATEQMRRMFNAGKRFAAVRDQIPVYQAFDTMADYRRACRSLPKFYGLWEDGTAQRSGVVLKDDDMVFNG